MGSIGGGNGLANISVNGTNYQVPERFKNELQKRAHVEGGEGYDNVFTETEIDELRNMAGVQYSKYSSKDAPVNPEVAQAWETAYDLMRVKTAVVEGENLTDPGALSAESLSNPNAQTQLDLDGTGGSVFKPSVVHFELAGGGPDGRVAGNQASAPAEAAVYRENDGQSAFSIQAAPTISNSTTNNQDGTTTTTSSGDVAASIGYSTTEQDGGAFSVNLVGGIGHSSSSSSPAAGAADPFSEESPFGTEAPAPAGTSSSRTGTAVQATVGYTSSGSAAGRQAGATSTQGLAAVQNIIRKGSTP